MCLSRGRAEKTHTTAEVWQHASASVHLPLGVVCCSGADVSRWVPCGCCQFERLHPLCFRTRELLLDPKERVCVTREDLEHFGLTGATCLGCVCRCSESLPDKHTPRMAGRGPKLDSGHYEGVRSRETSEGIHGRSSRKRRLGFQVSPGEGC